MNNLNKQQGFTMIELIIVISVLFLLMIITIRWPGKTINLNAQTQQLANDIRYVQFLAMSNDKKYTLTFDSANNQYSINIGVFPVKQSNIVNIETGILMSTTNLPNNYLIFDGKGIPYTDSLTPLATIAYITLSIEGQTKTITILPETGKVDIS